MRYFKIKVTGRGEFPWDMLRFGGCYPATTTDAMNLPVTDETFRDPRTIELITTARNAVPLLQTCDRFKSFLWAAEYVEV
jgi:hypothetical protein